MKHALGRAAGFAATTVALTASLVVTMSGPAAAATTRFVALTGSDTVPANNSCTNPAAPCRTINHAVTVAVPGDTISVAAGTYANERPIITKAVAVVGAGASSTVIDAGAILGSASPTFTVSIPIASSDQDVSISAMTITGGRSALGGGVFHAAGDLTISDAVITGNVGGGVSDGGVGGGGIGVLGTLLGTAPTLTLERVTVSANRTLPRSGTTAPLPGAGLYTAGPVTMTDTTFSGNIINGVGIGALGGGIYVNRLAANDDPVVVGDADIVGNTASFGGGVFVASSATYHQTGGTIAGNTAINGGGLYVAGVGSTHRPDTNGSATLEDVAVDGNTAQGGAVVNGGNGGGILNAGSLIADGASMAGNQALASTAASLATGWGGGIYTGPIGAGDKPATSLDEVSIVGTGATPNAFVGGGLAVAGNVFGVANVTLPAFTAQDTTLQANTATLGGAGAYLGVSATFTGGTVSGNQVASSSGIGGGFWLAKNPASSPNPTLTVGGTQITLNHATSGGGIAVGSGSTVATTGASIDHNSATFGAGIINAGTVAAASTGIDDNTSAFQGGGLWNGSSVVTDAPTFTGTSGTTLDGNTAASAGGGAAVGARSSFTLTGGSISGNLATSAGGLYIAEGATGVVATSTIEGNTANGLLAGGVLNSGTTTISDSTLRGNHAPLSSAGTGLGGAVYNGSSAAGNTASLVIDRSTLIDNDAATGSAVYARSTGAGGVNKVSIRNSTITANHTTGGWTALATFHPVTVINSTVTANTSPAGATGGLFVAPGGSIGLAGSIVSGNSGPGNCNVAVVDGGANLTDPGDATCGLPVAQRLDPQLQAPADNGGPTVTQLPAPSSPAIDAVPPSTATGLTDAVSGQPVVLCAGGDTDQRGIARPQGAACDIGSVEALVQAPVVDGPTNPVFVAGTAGPEYHYTSIAVPTADLAVASPLPAGLTFTDNGDGTATLTGTPAAGTAGVHAVTIVASNGVAPDGTLAVTIQIDEPAAIEGPVADTYTVGVADSTHFTATGVPTPTLSTASTLPGGISFTDNGDGTGDLHGTPADGAGGVYAVVIDATNGVGDVAHHAVTLTVVEAPTVAGPASATYTVGTAGGPTLFTTDGYPAATLSVTGDPLPEGVTFTDHGDGTGSFSGTPAGGEGGDYHLTVTASNGVAPDDATSFTLTVDEAPSVIGPAAVRFVIGSADTIGYSADGFPVATLALSGDALPAGISFTDHGGGAATLEGTAPAGSAGTYHVTVTAANGVDPDGTLEVTIEVVEPVAITTTTLPGGAVGVPYVAHVAADGGGIPYAFSLAGGALPPGLALAADGTISGTPTGPAGTSTFTVQVDDSLDPAQTDTQQLSITIGRGPTSLSVSPVVLTTTGGLIKVTVGRVSARLTGGSPAVGIPGQAITFKAGATTVCSAVTAADGTATCTTSLLGTVVLLLSFGVNASYAGSSSWLPAAGSAGLL